VKESLAIDLHVRDVVERQRDFLGDGERLIGRDRQVAALASAIDDVTEAAAAGVVPTHEGLAPEHAVRLAAHDRSAFDRGDERARGGDGPGQRGTVARELPQREK
jgi:hypothetical protein